MSTELARLSVNQITVRSWSVPELIDGCVRAGIPAIGLWREHVTATGLAETATRVADAGLRVSSLCRGGFVTAASPAAFSAALDDNRRAIDEAAQLGAACLVLVTGGLPPGSRDLPAARARIAESLAELVPYARERAVKLALEPLHPMFCAERSVLSTLAQALTLAAPFGAADMGVVVDAYHVWWDPALKEQAILAGPRIASFQVCDWITPLPADVLLGRGMMGDGHIDLAGLTSAVHRAGYRGDVEVEIFNSGIWNSDPSEVLATLRTRYKTHILPHLR